MVERVVQEEAETPESMAAYRQLYRRTRSLLEELEQRLVHPPTESVLAALGAFWGEPDSWTPDDASRMRRAVRAATKLLIAGVRTLRYERGVREFNSIEVAAATAAIRTMPPGLNDEEQARVILKAVSAATHR